MISGSQTQNAMYGDNVGSRSSFTSANNGPKSRRLRQWIDWQSAQLDRDLIETETFDQSTGILLKANWDSKHRTPPHQHCQQCDSHHHRYFHRQPYHQQAIPTSPPAWPDTFHYSRLKLQHYRIAHSKRLLFWLWFYLHCLRAALTSFAQHRHRCKLSYQKRSVDSRWYHSNRCQPSSSSTTPADCIRVTLQTLVIILFVLLCTVIWPSSALNADEEFISSTSYTFHHRHHQQPQQKQTDIGLNITKILNAFFDSGYDKRVRPNYAGPPVQVGVTMHIISISSISAVQMDFTSDFYFRQSWRDSRLMFKPRPGIKALFVGAEVVDKIWVPDTFFANEKSAQFHMATTPNTFIRIKSNGEVFRSMRLTVTSSCPMNLQYFPMDRQSCTIEIESYGYSMKDIQYKWGIEGIIGSVVLAKNLELPQFSVYKHRQKQKIEVLSTGNYSRLVCEIEFVRSMGYYLIQIYIPASLIVIISWVSFWLHRNASPARVQLGVTTVLTMTTLMSSTNAAMPKISYIKSIDVFLGTCFVMVFAALLEYATVGYMGKRIAMRKTRTQQIVRLLNEHREKCIAAAAAAAAGTEEKSHDEDESHHRGTSAQRQNALLRTASLYPSLERIDLENIAHKRDIRSGSMAGHSCYNQPHSHYSGASAHHQHHSTQPLERSASLKSRVYSDNGDDQELSTGINNFNDDLSVFVPAASIGHSATAVGGSYYGSTGPHSPTYHRGRGLDRFAAEHHNLLPSSYLLKNHNTLFGVCPSDIDKYSRVVFPVCFLCFNLMYWIIYMHISEFLIDDQNVTTSEDVP